MQRVVAALIATTWARWVSGRLAIVSGGEGTGMERGEVSLASVTTLIGGGGAMLEGPH